MKKFGKSRIKRAYDLGEKAFDYAEEQEKKHKRKPKVESYEINAKNQKDAIRQVKALELPEEVEKENSRERVRRFREKCNENLTLQNDW